MCGRFNVDVSVPEMRSLLEELGHVPGAPRVKTGEIFPTNVAAVLAAGEGRAGPRPMVWGFPRWDGKGVVFNARAETAGTKPLFRDALLHRHVAVPCTGFYEWKAAPGKQKKNKYLFRETGRELMYLAGLYGVFPREDAAVPERFTILTTEANQSMAPYHNRMPVLLHAEETEVWLRGGPAPAFLERIPFEVEAEAAEPASSPGHGGTA